MKKIISSLVLGAILLLPIVVLAQPPVPPPGWGEIDIWNLLDTIFDYVFWILIAFAAIMIVIAGYTFITAAGDPEKIKKARDFVLYALIGVLVGLAAKGLVMLVSMMM